MLKLHDLPQKILTGMLSQRLPAWISSLQGLQWPFWMITVDDADTAPCTEWGAAIRLPSGSKVPLCWC